MKLNETIEMMVSEDYKERFKAEYFQLKVRIDGLKAMLEKYKDGTLSFIPKCSYELLDNQREAMETYLERLEERAMIEEIVLFN